MLLSLLYVTTLSAVCVGVVYQLTKNPIRKTENAKNKAALNAVLPEFDRIENICLNCSTSTSDTLSASLAYKDNVLVGIAVKTYTKKGFSGEIQAMVGFLPDGKINKVSILSHAETPGLGSKMTSPAFYSQFEGKSPSEFRLKVKKDGGDVDAITAATISSRAYCDALERAFSAYLNNKTLTTKGGNNE